MREREIATADTCCATAARLSDYPANSPALTYEEELKHSGGGEGEWGEQGRAGQGTNWGRELCGFSGRVMGGE